MVRTWRASRGMWIRDRVNGGSCVADSLDSVARPDQQTAERRVHQTEHSPGRSRRRIEEPNTRARSMGPGPAMHDRSSRRKQRGRAGAVRGHRCLEDLLEVALEGDESGCAANPAQGLAALVERLRQQARALFVMGEIGRASCMGRVYISV